MIATTRIIAPLGTAAIAANSFAVTAESFCYMPGYGIAEAATALVGQSLGAGKEKNRQKLFKSFGPPGRRDHGGDRRSDVFICPWVFQLMTPDLQVRQLAAEVLRIQLFAEPLRCVYRGFRSSPGSGRHSGSQYFKSDQYLGCASDPGHFAGRQMGTPRSVDSYVH